MQFQIIDILFFVVFFLIVIGLSMFKSRKEKTGEDYFLAGRQLTWPFIGLTLIAANISSEQIIGQAGSATASAGFAVAAWDWIAAVAMVIIAIYFLPRFLRLGIYTLPEFFEYRYNKLARAILAIYTIVLTIILASGVIYSGGITLSTIFNIKLIVSVLIIGFIAAIYTTWGGLKAVVWADLFQATALIVGGFVILFLGLKKVGGIEAFKTANTENLHTILKADRDIIPWTALVFAIWLPNFYYWGTNQFMVQKVLAAKNLRQGQYGILFAASLKLIMPFIIVIPGIIALQIYGDKIDVNGGDSAYPLLIKNLLTPGLKGFIFAALSGAIISTLASMLTTSSTIFTMDIFKRHWNKQASEKNIVTIGRVLTIVFMLICCIIAPQIQHFKHGVFQFMQEFGSYILPGGLAAFIFGLFVKRAPALVGNIGLIMSFFTFGVLHVFDPESDLIGWFYNHPHENIIRLFISCIYIVLTLIPIYFMIWKTQTFKVRKSNLSKDKLFAIIFLILALPTFGILNQLYGKEIVWLNRVAISFGIIIFVMAVLTFIIPLEKPVELPVKKDYPLKPGKQVTSIGIIIILVTCMLYFIFR